MVQTPTSLTTTTASGATRTIERLPDKLLMHIFSFLSHLDLCRIASVSRKWRMICYDPNLWSHISLRPEVSGLHVTNPESLLPLISTRFANALRYIEVPCELVTVPIIHELSNKCPNLKYMTLDFSNAMQLHDYSDLNAFPCNLKSLTICLSEVIFMEGFMRRVYQSLSSLQVLHLIGTFEMGDDAEEEIYEVINISKIRSQTPNLQVVNLYGCSFVDDSHIELLSGNCIHLEVLALNFCLRVKGYTLKALIQRCKKLQTLLMQHCGLEDNAMKEVDWQSCRIHELDLTSTELSEETLRSILLRIPSFTYLGLGYCEFFTDKLLEDMSKQGRMKHLRALDISHTVALNENAIFQFMKKHGSHLEGLMICGKTKLAEQFFLNIIPFIKNIRVMGMGTADGWFLKMSTKVHIDQIMICLAQNCPCLGRLEIIWDPDTIRYSENSSKFVDLVRLKCPQLKSITLSDGEYFEMVKSNFERADRKTVVRTTTTYSTSIVPLLHCFKDLLFN